MQLEQRRKLSVDDSLCKYFPRFGLCGELTLWCQQPSRSTRLRLVATGAERGNRQSVDYFRFDAPGQHIHSPQPSCSANSGGRCAGWVAEGVDFAVSTAFSVIEFTDGKCGHETARLNLG
jgi:hypothetical protein